MTRQNRFKHIARAPLPRLLVCLLIAAFASCALSACGDAGEYDAKEIASVAEAYYNEKYDAKATVEDISEVTEGGLFGTSSLDKYFCTMSDGYVVFYDRAEKRVDDVCKDNRQSAEILPIYIGYLRNFEQRATQRFANAGYKATFEFDDWYALSDEEVGECISYEEWASDDNDYSGSYFHTKFEDQGSDYIAEEKPHAFIRIDTCYAYISGQDAAYANGFPTDVPETPAWQATAEAVVADIEEFAGTMAHLEVYQAPDGTRNSSEGLLGDCFVNGYDNAWIICDYIDLGDGIWASSDEYGLRLRTGDLLLTDANDAITLDELIADGSTPKQFTSTAFGAYSLKFSDNAAGRAQRVLDELGMHGGGWISLSFAFDAASMTYSDGTPYTDTVRLYAVEKNKEANSHTGTTVGAGEDEGGSASDDQGENAEESDEEDDNESKYSLSRITYYDDELSNGMISGKKALYIDEDLRIVRM